MEKTSRSTLGAVALLALSTVFLPSVSLADPGNNYCVTPPFISGSIPPNLLLMIDNSASMYDLQYQDTTHLYCANSTSTACTSNTTCSSLGGATCNKAGTTTSTTTYSPKPCTADSQCPNSTGNNKCSGGFCKACNTNNGNGDCVSTTTITFTPTSCTTDANCQPPSATGVAGDTCNNKCNVTHQCYDTTYNNSSTPPYVGYFSSTDTYSYDFTNNKFVGGATMPASCTYSAGSPFYVCVNTTGAGTTSEAVKTDGTGFTASGNFLNWLSASKFDIEKQFLTGGKYDTTNSVLVAETRGCAGRKFIKSIPGTSLTFAVRGGSPGGISSTQSLATEYGQTYIDIYQSSSSNPYNADKCISAMNDWMNISSVSLGPFANDTKGCVGAGNGVINGTYVWNHILHNCYQGMTGGAQGYATNLNSLEVNCQSIYNTLTPSSITDPNSGSAICSSAISYVDGSGNAQTGYLGACYSSSTQTFNSPCDVTQMTNYCTLNVTGNPVVDPSTTSTVANVLSAPGFIMEQGLMNTIRVGTLRVQIAQSPPPTGLINKYQNQIRFGVMSFQNNGSGTECGSYTSPIPCVKTCAHTPTRVCYSSSDCPLYNGGADDCNALDKRDGGAVLSYIGAGSCSVTPGTACTVNSDCPSGEFCNPSIGSHSSGLVNTIDNIPATSWTPFGEAFYNAIGYLARSNDYTVNPPTSRSDGSLSQLPSPNIAASYLTSKNPSQYKCQRNNILLVTDGMSTADRSTASASFAQLYAGQVPYTIGGTTYNPGATGYSSSNVYGYDSTNSCPPYSGSRDVATLSWVAKNRNIKTLSTSTASTTAPQWSSEAISTYVVYNGQTTSSSPGLCDPYTLMNNTATNGGTTMYQASNPSDTYNQIDRALAAIAAQTSSGTAASILSNSEGSGANIVQAVFYPSKVFYNNTSAIWLGEMQNFWYYVDPLINNSTMREDTNADLQLNLIDDKVVSLQFDSATNTTWAYLSSDTNGDGAPDTTPTQESTDLVKSIWRAGKQLWSRNITSSPRTIYTSLLPNGTEVGTTGLMKFNYGTVDTTGAFPTTNGNLTLLPDNSAVLAPYLQMPTAAAAQKLMMYVHGFDFPNDTLFRSRTVQIQDPVSLAVSSGVWKLGDIISSTPRIQSTVRQNSYGLPSPSGYGDSTYNTYVKSSGYQNRGMVYVGANDGMLHAFNLGKLDVTASAFTKARLSAVAGTTLGEEQWAYIPKHALPYLKYASDKDYNHLYFVDGATVIVDASINDYTGAGGCTATTYDTCTKTGNTWRSILVGGTGLGGASGCSTDNCVQTPIADPAHSSNRFGYSSYYALDVTDPLAPKLLWEFSDPALGYATSGPAIVRVGSDPTKNGRWFAVFGSGPTGPIDTGAHQFGGNSDQTLKFFVVDLRSGDVTTIDTHIANAFAGSIVGGTIDTDRWNPQTNGYYQDDAIYVGYTKQSADAPYGWTDGGVLRVVTNESTTPTNADSSRAWTWSTVIDGIGPVTSGIARLQDRLNGNLWLYFGTGRYYNRSGASIDDYYTRRAIYGIKDPCYNKATNPGNFLDKTCMNTQTSVSQVDPSTLTNQSNGITTSGIATGWVVDLDVYTSTYGAERVVSDPVALTNGSVFFTSFEPSADPCSYGGNSFLWALDYKSGGVPSAASLAGKALIQLSTGAFQQIDLASAFGSGASRLNRRANAQMTGKPPTDAFPMVSKSGNKPVKRIMHIQER